MSVWRTGGVFKNGPDAAKDQWTGNGIAVKCPKCQADITIAAINGETPVRCPKCNYPMIRRADLLSIIAACKKQSNAKQLECVVGLLRRLSDYLPEAGTALGMLATQHPLPISEEEKWDRLISAYAGGDVQAQEWLNLMCHSHPGLYEQRPCGNCGAPKYFEKRNQSSTLCIYCQSTD